MIAAPIAVEEEHSSLSILVADGYRSFLPYYGGRVEMKNSDMLRHTNSTGPDLP